MYIYNVTVNIEESVQQDWLNWMKEVHIPEVLATGCFVDSRLSQVMVEEEQGITYSIQYRLEDLKQLEEYRQKFASRLQLEHRARYRDKFVAFRTILKIEQDLSP